MSVPNDPHPWSNPEHDIRADLVAAMSAPLPPYVPASCRCIAATLAGRRAEVRTPCGYPRCDPDGAVKAAIAAPFDPAECGCYTRSRDPLHVCDPEAPPNPAAPPNPPPPTPRDRNASRVPWFVGRGRRR